MASRIIVAIELTPPAKEAVETLTKKHGMPRVALLSRLIEWLAHQPPTIQASVVGPYSSSDSVGAAD